LGSLQQQNYLFCTETDATVTTVTPIGVKFCTMVDKGRRQVFSPFGGVTPKASPKSKILPVLKNEYLENGNSQRYMSISSTIQRELSKNVEYV